MIRDSSARHPLLDNLIQVLIPKLREQFAFCCVPPHNSGGLDQSLYESWVGRSWGHRSFLPGLCVDFSPGNSMGLLSGPLHRDCLARILSGFGLLFIFWPRYVFPAVSCLTYCLCQVCWQKMSDHLISIWDCHLVLRVTSLVSRTERVSVENELHRLSVSGKSEELSLMQVLNKLLLN